MPESATSVLIAGAGPTGLATAWTLVREGVPAASIRVIDARPNPIDGHDSRALGIHPRTLESLGPALAARLVAAGRTLGGAALCDAAGAQLLAVDLSDAVKSATRYPFFLTLAQGSTEAVMRASLAERGVRPEWGVRFAGLETGAGPGDARVVARLEHVAGGGRVEVAAAAFLVGADGTTSAVRAAAGIPLSAASARPAWSLLADVEVAGPGLDHATDALRAFLGPFPPGGGAGGGGRGRGGGRAGAFALSIPMERPGWLRLVFDGPPAAPRGRRRGGGPAAKPTLDEAQLRRLFSARIPFAAGWARGGRPPPGPPSRVASAALEVRSVGWTSAFRVREHVASSFRSGRVFLAGDAAHAHSPAGGQGMNLGIGDAAALGWRLAAVLQGVVPDGTPGAGRLLDAYSAERRPAAAGRVKATGLAWRVLMEARFRGFASVRNAVLRAVGASPRAAAALTAAASPRLTMLGLRYKPDGVCIAAGPGGGPWAAGSPGPGARAPLAAGALPDRLDEAGGRHLAVAWGGGTRAAACAAALPRAAFQVWPDPPAEVVAAFGGRPDRPGAVVVRPDGYVGWRGADLDGAAGWWARLVRGA